MFSFSVKLLCLVVFAVVLLLPNQCDSKKFCVTGGRGRRREKVSGSTARQLHLHSSSCEGNASPNERLCASNCQQFLVCFTCANCWITHFSEINLRCWLIFSLLMICNNVWKICLISYSRKKSIPFFFSLVSTWRRVRARRLSNIRHTDSPHNHLFNLVTRRNDLIRLKDFISWTVKGDFKLLHKKFVVF